jgi:hypothetical protein
MRFGKEASRTKQARACSTQWFCSFGGHSGGRASSGVPQRHPRLWLWLPALPALPYLTQPHDLTGSNWACLVCNLTGPGRISNSMTHAGCGSSAS